MKQSKMRSWTRGITTCLVLAMLAAPVQADDGSSVESDGWGKLLKYTACAVGIIAAPTGWALVFALVTCGVLFEAEAN